MAVESLRVGGNLLAAGDTSSRWTAGVWEGFPIEAIRNGNVDGFLREWDFATLKPASNVNAAEAYWDQGMRVFGDNGAALTVVNGIGLNATGMSFGSDGDNEGAGIRDQQVQVRLSRADKMFALELVGQTSTITDTKHGFFTGLIEDSAITATSPIAAAGTLADLNFVGFHRLEGDGDMLDLVYKANGITQVSQFTDAITLVAATDFRIGLTFNPAPDFQNGLSNVFRWWYNGKPILDTGTTAGSLGYKQIPSADGTDFPNDVAMGFIFTLLNATGTTPGTTTVRRVRYGQVF